MKKTTEATSANASLPTFLDEPGRTMKLFLPGVMRESTVVSARVVEQPADLSNRLYLPTLSK